MASNYRSALRAVIASESRAYGFTLIVWGTGALAIHRHGLPDSTGTVAYLGGLLGGIVLVALMAFGDPHATWRPSAESRRYAGGMIHLASVSGAVAAGWLSAALVVPTWPAFLSAGASASIVYQLVLAVEVIPSLTQDHTTTPPSSTGHDP